MKNFLLTLLFCVLYLFSNAQNFAWAETMGGIYPNKPNNIITDSSGDVYTIGNFNGTVDFDPGAGTYSISCVGGTDGFISKLDASGNFVFALSIAGTGTVSANAIARDNSGNIYVTGSFIGSVDFNPSASAYTLVSSSKDIFVLKLTTAGVFVWAKQMGGSSLDESYSIAVEPSGSVYTSGVFSGIADFDPSPATFSLTPDGPKDIFISKLDANGNFVWVKQLGGPSTEYPKSIAIDASNNVYLTGYFDYTVDFDPGASTYNLTAFGTQDVFISKLDINGNYIWAKQFGGTGVNTGGASVAVDAFNNIYTTGNFTGTSDFDPGPSAFNLSPIGGGDVFISKLDINGDFIWAKQMAATNNSDASSIATDVFNNVYSIGRFSGTVDFDPSPSVFNLTSIGSNIDTYISKLDANGNFVWAKQIGGDNTTYGQSITLDIFNNLFTSGFYYGTADFDPGPASYTVNSSGGNHIFIIKLSPPCSAPSITSIPPTKVCVNSAYTYSITTDIPSTFSWTSSSAQVLGGTSGTLSVISNTLIHPSSLSAKTITYSVTPTSTLGCIGTTQVFTVDVYPIPTLTVTSNPNNICVGNSSTLSATTQTLGGNGATSYLWNTGATTNSIVATPSVSIAYSVTATNSVGCINQAITTITVNSPAFVSVNSGSITSGQSFTLTANGASTYTFSNGATGGSIVVSPTITTTYTVFATSVNGCTNTATSTVTVTPACAAPTLTISGGGNFCLGQSKTLTSTGTASTYSWMPGGLTTSSIVVTPTITTVYTLTASNGGTCTSTYTVQLTANTNPVISTNASPVTICLGGSSNLTAGGATSYTWSNGALTNTTVVTPTVTTTYSVIGRSVVGCTTTKTIAVNVAVSPTIAVNSGSVCAGNSFTLFASGASTYTWNPSALTGYSIVVTPTANTSYSATGTNTNGCTHTAVSTVTVFAAPTITVNSGGVCLGGSFTMTPGGASTYTFSSGSAVVSPTATTSYTVYGTSSQGCAGTNSAVSTVSVSITPTIVVNSGSVCIGNSFTISPTGASTYTYSGGSAIVSPTINTTYTVTGANAFGCVGSAVVSTVTINTGPTLSITVNPNVACLGKTTTLTVSGANTYLWNTGAVTNTLSVTPNVYTVYTVTGTTTGCSATKTIAVNPIDIVLTSTVSNIACNISANTGSISLLPGGGSFPYYYSWSNGATTANIKNLAVGSYSVLVSDANGCVDSLQLSVTQPTSLTVSSSIVSPACGLNDGQISASVAGGTSPYTYIWNSGATTPVASSLTPGQYIVQVYDASNCYGSAIINLNPTNGPVVTVGTTNSITCYGGNNGSTSISISGGQAPVTTQWSNGSSANAISGLIAGVYDVLVTDGSGCKVNQSIAINQPNGLSVQPIITRPNCTQSNGAIDILVSGGQVPFTYTWSANAGSASTQNISGIVSGYYNVNIGYNGNCTQNFGFGVSDLTNLAINVLTVTPSSCTTPNGTIDITAVNGVPSYSFSWSTGAVTEDVSNVFPGTYFVTVTDADLCKISTSVFVPSNIYDYQPEICLISVDTSNNTNYLVWQKNITYGVEKYKIYRESSVPNNFQFVADVPFSALSEYTDLVANANVHSWRYRLSSVDSCGNEIPSYIDHKTIYLDVTFGASTNNLTWNYYAGFSYSKFYISRYDINNGWQLYDSVPGNVFTYTDILPPLIGNVRYLVEAKAPFSCVPQLKMAVQTSNKTKSNVKTNFSVLPTKIEELMNTYFYISPNPAKDGITISFDKPITSMIKIKITDVLGKELEDYTIYEGNKYTIPLVNYTSGLYFVHIQNGKNNIVKKFVKE